MSDVDQFLERARAAIDAGDMLVARGYLRRAARASPDRLDIWLDLCRVSERPQDKLECLTRVTELDPTDAEAQAELERIRQELAASEGPSQEEAPQNTDRETTESPPEASSAQNTVDTGRDARPTFTDMRLDITDEMRQAWDEAVAAGRPLVCIDHPHRETTLRCNRCDAPVCPECVVRTPVGLRCKECVKAQQASFYTARWYDSVIAAAISTVLSVIALVLVRQLGWWFALIISPFAGGLIGGAVHRAIGRRRGRMIWLVVAVCIILGSTLTWLTRPSTLLTSIIYAAMATAAAMGVLRLGRSR
jgi:hypothetical protein